MKLDLSGVKQFFANLGATLNALAASRKAIVGALGSIVSVAVIVLPVTAKYADKIDAYVALFFGLVILGVAIEDFAKHIATSKAFDLSAVVAALKEALADWNKAGLPPVSVPSVWDTSVSGPIDYTVTATASSAPASPGEVG